MRKQGAPGSIQTNWFLSNQGYVWESRGLKGWQCYQKPGTSGWVYVRYSESFRVKICVFWEKTWKQVLSKKMAADKPKLKNKWKWEGKQMTECLRMCAHSGRLSMGRKESRHTTKGRTERKQPGILDITENCLYIPTLFSFSTLLSQHTYLYQDELYCRESLRSNWVNLSNAPFQTRVFRLKFSSLPKSLLLRSWLIHVPSAARTGERKLKIRLPGLFPTCRIRRCTLTWSANICVYIEALPCVIFGISPTVSQTS